MPLFCQSAVEGAGAYPEQMFPAATQSPSQEENQVFPSLGAASLALGSKPRLKLFLLTCGTSKGELPPPSRAEEEPAQPGRSVEPQREGPPPYSSSRRLASLRCLCGALPAQCPKGSPGASPGSPEGPLCLLRGLPAAKPPRSPCHDGEQPVGGTNFKAPTGDTFRMGSSCLPPIQIIN